MYYIIGDIHGMLRNLSSLYKILKKSLTDEDTLIFLGDYIDRGLYSYEVVEYLIMLSEYHKTVFLKGNHEDMFLNYKSSNDSGIFLSNGGSATLRSYKKNIKSHSLPEIHQNFYDNLDLFFETEEFVAVHAGLNPKINNIYKQLPHDLIWIRENFFRSAKIWEKTVIFGHTPCAILHSPSKEVYFNDYNNIIGIDTGACYGGKLSCLRWPDRKIFQA